MGKTVQKVNDFGQLSALRANAPVPEYVYGPKVVPDLARGYSYPEFIFDTLAGANSEDHINIAQAAHLAPLSAVCSSHVEAVTKFYQVLQQASSKTAGLPAFDRSGGVGPSYTFTPNWEQPFSNTEPSLLAINIQVDAQGATRIDPTLPLIVTRVESSGPDAWALATYAYDAYRDKWFYSGREGVDQQNAYVTPFSDQTFAAVAGNRKRVSLRANIAKMQQQQATAMSPLLDQRAIIAAAEAGRS